MGQCSTLPADTRPSNSAVSRHEHFHAKEMLMEEQRHRLKEEGRKQSLDFNKIEPHPEDRLEEIRMETRRSSRILDMKQSREADAMRAAESPVPMDVDYGREDVPALPLPVPPPECSVPTRCYKLNLDSDIIGLSTTQKQHLCLGPFSEPPPQLTYSSSEDSSAGIDTTTVAIQTAQIFRGITVGRDGTILSQNARATRSNRGKGAKRGEKSRQACKIDKAKDLVEEIIATGKAPESDEPANMVSLYIMGEYDDMKYLVRDGSKKLREANGNGLTDDHLRAVNRPRHRVSTQRPVASSSMATAMLSPRKRVSPSLVTSQRTAALQNPEKLSSGALPHSAPPKLKSHPRDTRPSRREVPKMRLDACHDFMDPRRAAPGDADWSHAWNIWNCGLAGNASPVQPSSPKDTNGPTPVFEGRESNGNLREGASVTRAD
mmetsp:Transcript_23067/g.43910  ORF Transcript_23067/g.43910 Transcript_23067/m.43910 type:complete len:433 (-) Transcript_23067:121-1419(-)|eukprot:scaffold1771_cov172-Amphora_coffeaeformis.AAC.16